MNVFMQGVARSKAKISGREQQAQGCGDVVATSIGAGVLGAPIGYVSGTNLSGTATWDNATFASLGVTPGTYVWTWGTAAEQSFTLDVVNSVPEPAALSIFGFGVLLTGAFMGLASARGLAWSSIRLGREQPAFAAAFPTADSREGRVRVERRL